MTQNDSEKLKAIIVDDEELARQGLAMRLAEHKEVEVVQDCQSGREAIEAIVEHEPDVVFLDIQMPGMNGFDVLKALAGKRMPMIVFVTAYDEYAVRAFDAHAIDYLLKPIDENRLEEALSHIREQWEQREAVQHRTRLLEIVAEMSGEDCVSLDEIIEKGRDAVGQKYLSKLPIKDGRITVRVEVRDINWIDAAGDYMCVHANGVTHILRGTMKKLEDCLDPKFFQRIHRSTIVNIDRVKEVRSHMNGEYFLSLDNGIELKLSRHYKEKIKYFVGA